MPTPHQLCLCLLVSILLFLMWNWIRSQRLACRAHLAGSPTCYLTCSFLAQPESHICEMRHWLQQNAFSWVQGPSGHSWRALRSLCTCEIVKKKKKNTDVCIHAQFSGERAHKIPHILNKAHFTSDAWWVQGSLNAPADQGWPGVVGEVGGSHLTEFLVRCCWSQCKHFRMLNVYPPTTPL